MKKIFMSLAAVVVLTLAASLVSCDPNREQCRKVTLTERNSTYPDCTASKVQTFLSRENCHN